MDAIRSWFGLRPAGDGVTTPPPPPPALPAASPPPPSRVDAHERFVGFAFAAAEMVLECDPAGVVSYAAGAFRSRLGRQPESCIGRPLRDLVAPSDQDAIDTALMLLLETGRLPPMIVRLSDPRRTPLAFAGIAVATNRGPPRLCLTFAQPPTPLGGGNKTATSRALARAALANVQAGLACHLGLIEIQGPDRAMMAWSGKVEQTMAAVAPDAVEIAPGRFGVLGSVGRPPDLLSIATDLEKSLHAQDVTVSVASSDLALAGTGLTPVQTAMALRQALNLFARHGAGGLSQSGFDGGLAGYVRRASAQAADLRALIDGGEFTLAFQPIVSLEQRATHHYEALIRPKPRPSLTFAAPQDFVMLVEAVGLAEELDLAVARLACRAAAQARVRVAFNLSGQSMQSAAFRARLIEFLSQDEASKAGLMIVEMTETAEVDVVDEVALTAEALRSLGVPFCLDDFGAGAADIRLMRRLLPNIVKLDGSYITGISDGGRERALVAGMVEIARAIGAEVVAERVETEAEADSLRGLGVQYGQGWLFGRPALLPGSLASSRDAKPGRQA